MSTGFYKRTEAQIRKLKEHGFQKGYTPYNKGLPPEKQGHWKGGQTISNGYIYIHNPNHPRTNKRHYVKKCILVMEKHLGRFLTKEEIIHHKGINFPILSIQNKQDDNIENLQLFNNKSEHQTTISHKYKQFVYRDRKKEYMREYHKKHKRKTKSHKSAIPVGS